MRKKLLYVLIAILSCFSLVIAQSTPLAYYDAIMLSDSTIQPFEYFKILVPYLSHDKFVFLEDTLVNKTSDNPFLNKITQEMFKKYPPHKIGHAGVSYDEMTFPNVIFNNASSSPSSAPGISLEQNLITGTVQFIAQRFQDEIIQAFITKLRDYLKTSEEAKLLFPSTYTLINTDNSIWAYGTMIQLLKTSFQSDLNKIPRNLNSYLQNNTKFSPSVKTSVEVHILSDLLRILDQLQSGQHPADIIGALNESALAKGNDITLSSLVKIISVMSNTMREDSSSTNAWVSVTKINSMSTEQKNLMLGLIFQQIKDYKLLKDSSGKWHSLGNLVSENSKNLEKIEMIKQQSRVLQNFISETTQAIETAKKYYDNAKNQGQSLNLYLNYLDAVFQIFEKSLDQGIFTLIPLQKDWQQKINTYELIIFHIRQLIQNYQQKEYAACISNTMVILQLCDNDFGKHVPMLFHYASFLASLTEAKDADQVKNAIEAAALPVGSFSLKRKSSQDLSINAYVGLGNGWETLQNGYFLGLTAPIGISYSFRLGDGFIQAMSIHFNLFDFGMPLSANLKDSSKVPTNLQLKNLLALGPGILFHFHDLPLTSGVSFTYTPDVRNVTGIPDKQSSWKLMFFIAVDIPIFDIFNISSE
jgi:hypothetical protein